MPARFFAHSGKQPDRSDWQELLEHLEGVAERAARAAAKFDAGEWGRIAGLLHDLGKYSEPFQLRLAGASVRVDHSTAGARAAQERFGLPGRLLAYAIAGHHTGLANGRGDGDPTPLKARLDPTKRAIPDCAGWERDLTLPAQLVWPALAPYPDKMIAANWRGLCLSLFTRMVFSALVDGDRVDTEAFYANFEGQGEVRRGNWQPLTRLRQHLERHMAEKTALAELSAENAGQRTVNAERAQILEAARAKARLEPGLFSLTVPTGGGKTLASLTFALDHAVEYGLDRVIYVIPFTSIIEQTARVFRDALGEGLADHVIEHHSAFREDEALAAMERAAGGESGLQAGERLRLATENWDAPIIVTTAVQFFESLFSNRPSSCRKLHNIARSVVVLDEAQTLPLKLLRPCVAVVDELARNYRTSVVLCTATQPALSATREDGSAGFEGGLVKVRKIIDDEKGLYQRLRRVTVLPPMKLDDAGLVEQLRQHDKVLCIVGTRAHARELYSELEKACGEGVFHISALMCPAHRSQRLVEIKAALKSGSCRVVATTVVEAGVDVDFPRVYRAMAGLDSIAQAAGRCNREGKLQPGDAIVQPFEIAGRKSIQELRVNEGVAREVLRQHGRDPLGLAAIEAYFGRLYWQKTQGRDDQLDASTNWPDRRKTGILHALNLEAHEGWLPFADVAAAFRMIESLMEPVIIPFDETAEALLAELARSDLERPGRIARKLQPYIVNVPRTPFEAMRRSGRLAAINEYRFGDQFIALTSEGRDNLYRDDVGLDWSDPTFRQVESSII